MTPLGWLGRKTSTQIQQGQILLLGLKKKKLTFDLNDQNIYRNAWINHYWGKNEYQRSISWLTLAKSQQIYNPRHLFSQQLIGKLEPNGMWCHTGMELLWSWSHEQDGRQTLHHKIYQIFWVILYKLKLLIKDFLYFETLCLCFHCMFSTQVQLKHLKT